MTVKLHRKPWLCKESLKTPSSRPILIYFEFRSKPSLITVIWMDPHSPQKFIATKYCFPILGDDTSFFFFLSFFLCFFIFRFYDMLCYIIYFVIINFCKNCFLSIVIVIFIYYYYFYLINEWFFHKKIFQFFHVSGCSGMFRNAPGFIDAPDHGTLINRFKWLGWFVVMQSGWIYFSNL